MCMNGNKPVLSRQFLQLLNNYIYNALFWLLSKNALGIHQLIIYSTMPLESNLQKEVCMQQEFSNSVFFLSVCSGILCTLK